MTALDPLAGEPRWVAWRCEWRGKDGTPTKVPYAPNGRKAKADDSSTWGTRKAVEARAARIVNGQGGGIGIQLGDLGADTHLCGIDLDSCFSEDAELEPWAAEIVAAIPTYTERSPSGRGLKLYFYMHSEDVRPFLDRIGVRPDAWGTRRGVPGQDGRDHGPAIEVYCALRYFAVTDDRWPEAPDKLATLDASILDRLAALIPTARSTTSKGPRGGDNSRSGIAFRKVIELRRAGTATTFDEMVEALRADPETADWVRDKGEVASQRELRRIWEKTEPQQPKGAIVVRSGLRHEAADAGVAALDASGVPFYQRDRSIVRVCMVAAKTADGQVTHAPGVVDVSYAQLGRALGQVARWERVDKNDNRVRIDPPRDVVEQIADMAGEWPFPLLSGVIGTPTMRPDGSLLLSEGYDEATGLVLLGPRQCHGFRRSRAHWMRISRWR